MTVVLAAQALFSMLERRLTRWSLPVLSLVYPGCSFSSPIGFTKLTRLRLHD